MKYDSISIFNFVAQHTQFAHLIADGPEIIYHVDLKNDLRSLGVNVCIFCHFLKKSINVTRRSVVKTFDSFWIMRLIFFAYAVWCICGSLQRQKVIIVKASWPTPWRTSIIILHSISITLTLLAMSPLLPLQTSCKL